MLLDLNFELVSLGLLALFLFTGHKAAAPHPPHPAFHPALHSGVRAQPAGCVTVFLSAHPGGCRCLPGMRCWPPIM